MRENLNNFYINIIESIEIILKLKLKEKNVKIFLRIGIFLTNGDLTIFFSLKLSTNIYFISTLSIFIICLFETISKNI